MFFKLKKYLVIFICVMPAFAWGETPEEDSPQVLVSYPLPKPHSHVYLYKEWKIDEDLIPGKYNLKANIALKTTPHPVEFDSLDLIPKSSTGNRQLTQTINKEIKIDDFDEIQIDFRDTYSDNPSLINLKMVLSGEKLKGNTTTVMIKNEDNKLVPSVLSDLDSSPWKKKEPYYIAKRWLQLSFDSRWRYTFKPNFIFFQKRFHHDFSSAEALDIVFKPETSYKDVHSLNCNLRFNYESKLRPSKIVECAKFPQRLIKTKGKLIRRISVRKENRPNYIKNGRVYLSEIIFIAPGNMIESIQKQPIESVTLQSQADKSLIEEEIPKGSEGKIELKPVFHFSSSSEGPLGQRKLLILPLRQFTDNVGKNGIIHSLTLSAKALSSKSPHEFHLKRLRAVSFKNEERPSIFDLGEKINSRWVDPTFEFENNDSKFAHTHVYGYLPFHSLKINKETPSQAKNFLTANTGASKQNKTIETVNFAGTQIKSQNHFSTWNPDKNGLQLTGLGRWVEIDWPVRMKFTEDTQLLVGIDEMASYLDSIQAQPIIQGKALPPIFLLPNKAKELKGISGTIDGFKIRLYFSNNQFNVRLKEFAVIRPQRLSQDKILETPIFFDGEMTLFPKNIQSFPKGKVTIASGHLGAALFAPKSLSNELSWETEVRRKITWVQGLKVTYKIFPQIKLDNSCWLQFSLATSKRKIDHTLCPEGSSGQIIIPEKTLFKNLDLQANEVLDNITWKTQAKTKISSQPFSPLIDIGMKLIGQHSSTINNELMQYPFVELNGKSIYLEVLNQIPSENISSGNFDINLGSVGIKIDTSFKKLKHPYLNVTSLVLEKLEPLSEEQFENLTKDPPKQIALGQKENFLSLSRLFFILLLILVILWVAKLSGSLHRFQEWLKPSSDTARRQIIFFALMATAFYLLGLYFSLIRWHLLEETFLSLAGLPILLAMRIVIWWARPHLESRWPELATHIYRGPGTPYIALFFVALMFAVFFLVFPVKVLAEHIGVNSYYFLVVGVYLEVKALQNEKTKSNEEDTLIAPENEAERA